ncbi:MAG: hypothetical protein OXG58_02290 [Gemmatimonadetes bacterium]|nr:hypothetical protein [Gemmatimonadota bacterium]
MVTLAWLIPSTTASAQDAAVTAALEELQRERQRGELSWQRPHIPAVAILRQASGPRTPAELDAFADRLAAMAADATLPEHVRDNADRALMGAASTDPRSPRRGKPYARAFDLLLRLYEGGANDVLSTIFRLDPERGPAYVRDVFERSERPMLCLYHRPEAGYYVDDAGELTTERPDPPECARGYRTFHETTWCKAGYILYKDIVYEAERRTWPDGGGGPVAGEPHPMSDGLPEHVEDWYRRCQ